MDCMPLPRKLGSDTVQRVDLGSATVSQVADVIQKHQLLTWNYMVHIAMPESWGQHGPDKTVRIRHPKNPVSSNAFSKDQIEK